MEQEITGWQVRTYSAPRKGVDPERRSKNALDAIWPKRPGPWEYWGTAAGGAAGGACAGTDEEVDAGRDCGAVLTGAERDGAEERDERRGCFVAMQGN